AARKVVELLLAGRVRAGAAFQRGGLVMGVVVNVEVRPTAEPLHDQVDELLESALLFRTVSPPKRAECRLTLVNSDEAKQVLEPLVEERIALHVEEDVALRGAREPGETASRLGR